MERTRYVVTYLGDYPCGHRHPLSISMMARDAADAFTKAQETLAFTDDRLTSTNHTLFSVTPEEFNENTIANLDVCPNAEVKSC
ncbi:hypothetical protein KKJ06_19400 [Xenorhabdus bovienii]|uniref:hypothetical protein n=1 Tax=Xenorhabdus bovienii TaxID=40576 RepID=UPI0023B238A1|nr:hypothetical protein [Xenorhabdus bovienii]MDE9557530.1 hypothetical protein [Xenorhabdus bovienii]